MKIYPSNMNHLRFTKPTNQEIQEQYFFPCSITVLNQSLQTAELFYYDGEGNEFPQGRFDIPSDYLFQKALLKTDTAPTTKGLYPLSETGVYTNLGGINAQSGKLNFASFDGTTWSLITVDLLNGTSVIPDYNPALSYVEKSMVVKDYSIWRVADGQTANAGDVPGVSSKWVAMGEVTQEITNNITNVTNNITVDPNQIVPTESLYYQDDTVAVDLLKRVDKTTGEDVNFRETLVWYDGSAMNDSKVDGVIYIKENSKYYKRDFKSINAKWYGARDNELSTDALRKWLDASIFGELFLPSGIYLVDNDIRIKAPGTIRGLGTIKRANQVVTTTTTNVTTSTNPTVIGVTSTTGFRIGMGVTVTTGFNNADGCFKQHIITAIGTNTITVNTNFTKDMASGSKLITHHGILSTYGTIDSVKIEGITIDGNMQNNSNYAAWQINSSAYISANNSEIRNCKFINNQADGLIAGGNFLNITGNLIKNSGGNGLHLSGLSNCNISNNRIINSTLSISGNDNTTGPDHAEGAITWSELISDVIVDGNYIDGGRTIIGGIGGQTNNEIQFVNNICKNATYQAIELTQHSDNPNYGQNYIFANNKFYDCKSIYINNSSAGSTDDSVGFKNIIISGNLFSNSWIQMNRAKKIVINSNIFEGGLNTFCVSGDRLKDINISNNIFRGSTYAVLIETGYTDISISNNTFIDFNNTGIYVNGENSSQNALITGNYIKSSQLTGNIKGIYAGLGSVAKNNVINIASNNGIGIILSGDSVSNPTGVQGGIATDNNIIVHSNGYSIRIYGGVSNCVAQRNQISKAVQNAEPLHNSVDQNYIIGTVYTPPLPVFPIPTDSIFIDFDQNRSFGSINNPITSNFSQGTNPATVGVVAKIYHKGTIEPTYPANWIKSSDSATYDPSKINRIYAEYEDANHVFFKIEN